MSESHEALCCSWLHEFKLACVSKQEQNVARIWEWKWQKGFKTVASFQFGVWQKQFVWWLLFNSKNKYIGAHFSECRKTTIGKMLRNEIGDFTSNSFGHHFGRISLMFFPCVKVIVIILKDEQMLRIIQVGSFKSHWVSWSLNNTVLYLQWFWLVISFIILFHLIPN